MKNALRSSCITSVWLLAFAGGCYAATDPSGADTHTNWLTCESDADCSGGAVCVAGRCSEEERTPASACTGDGGACDAASEVTTVNAPASTSAAPDAGPQPPGMRVTAIAAATGADGSFVVSDPRTQAHTPVVSWVDDHFVVAFGAGGDGVAELRLEVASVYPERIESRWVSYPDFASGLDIAADGQLANVRPNADATACVVDFFEPDLAGDPRSLTVPCDDTELTAVAAAGTGGSWLIATAQGDEVQLGRYEAARAEWAVELTRIGGRGDARVVSLVADSEGASVAWGGGRHGDSRPLVDDSVAARVAHVGTAPAESEVLYRVRFPGAIHNDGAHGLAEVSGRLLVFGMDNTELWSAVVADDGETPAVNMVAPSGVEDRQPGVAPIVDRGLVGVCFATGPGPWGGFAGSEDGVAFVVVDADGLPVAEPRVLASGLVNIGGCDVAWSGEEFLVVWWDIDNGATPRINLIRGMRLPGPGRGVRTDGLDAL